MKPLNVLGGILVGLASSALIIVVLFPVSSSNPELFEISWKREIREVRRKDIPHKYRSQITEALKYYPELKDDSIIFELTDYGAPLESTFVVSSLVLPWNERVYKVLIREEGNSDFDPVLVKNLSSRAQTAIIAHELSHTLFYKQLHTFEIASWGLHYLLMPAYAQSHERFADVLVVKRGLGEELLEYAAYVRGIPEFRQQYEDGDLKWIDRYYLTPAEIEALVASVESEIPE